MADETSTLVGPEKAHETSARQESERARDEALWARLDGLERALTERISDRTHPIDALSEKVQALNDNVTRLALSTKQLESSTKRQLDELKATVKVLGARLSDEKSLQRSIGLASAYVVAPYSNDAAPRGRAFQEGPGSFGPRSPFAQ